MAFDGQFANTKDLTAVNEWALTYVVRDVAHNDVDIHAKLRRDIAALTPVKAGSKGAISLDVLQAAALIEAILPVKFTMFSTENNLMEMMDSDPFTFNSSYSD